MKKLLVYAAMGLGVVGYGVMTKADRDGSGAIIDGGSVDAFQVRAGDCFDDSGSLDEQITSLPGVPCAEPHDNEAYAIVSLSLPEYPDEEVMSSLAFDECMARFEPFVGRDYESSTLDIFSMYPTVESWAADDREVVCAVYDMEGQKLEGSVKNLGL